MPTPHRRHLSILAGLFAAWWIVLAIAPYDRAAWALENAAALAGVGVLALLHRRLSFSRLSYTLIFVFLCLHLVGGHYTYPRVPFGDTLQGWFGWQRNHYDRLVHFAYGLCFAYPIREIFLRVVRVRGFWGYFLPLDLTMSTSMLFELAEWGVVAWFGGGLGHAYLGTQGDDWDAHKDMALASLGALVTMCVTAAVNLRFQRDFAREWAESLRVRKKRAPHEDALPGMLSPTPVRARRRRAR